MHGGSRQEEDHDSDYEDVEDSSQYYQILGVPKNATQQQIKIAYEKLAATLHPEQNEEDEQKMQEITEAYETLGDPQRRADYDEHGKAEEQEGAQDLFDMFFRGGNKGKANQKMKVQSTQQVLQVTLDSIYRGDTINFPHVRTRCCEKCEGKGGANVKVCEQCKGKGGSIEMHQVGPGMYQQVQRMCQKCSGKGELMDEADRCQVCEGKKIVEKETSLQVKIEQGTPNSFPIKISGEGNQIPDAIPGDLILVTKEKEHQVFKRNGADLEMRKNVTLAEALTGFEFSIEHLDGKKYTIATSQGQIIGDETKKIVRGLGMPFFKNPSQHGNLVVEFHVVMPKRGELSKDQIASLVAMLPGEVDKRPEGDYKMFEELDREDLNTNEEGGKKPEDEYDEEAEQQGISCATQ